MGSFSPVKSHRYRLPPQQGRPTPMAICEGPPTNASPQEVAEPARSMQPGWLRVRRRIPCLDSRSSRKQRFPARASTEPSGEYLTRMMRSSRLDISTSGVPSGMLHRRTVPSSEVEASRSPSGEKATLRTSSVCPFSTATLLPVATSHRRTLSSADPVASQRPSGERSRLNTSSLWPTNDRRECRLGAEPAVSGWGAAVAAGAGGDEGSAVGEAGGTAVRAGAGTGVANGTGVPAAVGCPKLQAASRRVNAQANGSRQMCLVMGVPTSSVLLVCLNCRLFVAQGVNRIQRGGAGGGIDSEEQTHQDGEPGSQ